MSRTEKSGSRPIPPFLIPSWRRMRTRAQTEREKRATGTDGSRRFTMKPTATTPCRSAEQMLWATGFPIFSGTDQLPMPLRSTGRSLSSASAFPGRSIRGTESSTMTGPLLPGSRSWSTTSLKRRTPAFSRSGSGLPAAAVRRRLPCPAARDLPLAAGTCTCARSTARRTATMK